MSNRKPLEDFQTSLWRLLSSEKENWVGSKPPSLDRYEKEYRHDLKSPGRKSSLSNLARAISKADLIYVGDDHTLTQSRESFLFLLQRAFRHRKHLTIGLEMVHAEDQETLDRFLQGKLSEPAFLKAIRYWERWGFDWESYRKILLFAKKNQLSVLALNHEGRGSDALRKRDEKAAKKIVDFLGSQAGSTLFVLFGEQHVSESHLPRCVDECLRHEGIELRSVIVHQNSVMEETKHHHAPRVQVLRQGERSFRVLSSSPLAALGSHLEWLETRPNKGNAPNKSDREELRALLLDRIHTVALALSVLLECDDPSLDRFELLLDNETNDALKLAREAGLSNREIAALQWETKHLPVLLVPKTSHLLLNDTSFSGVCEGAGLLLARGEEPLTLEEDALTLFCMQSFRSGLAYFVSKLFDPYRTAKPIQHWLQNGTEQEQEEIRRWRNEFRKFLRQPETLSQFVQALNSLTPTMRYALARSTGEIFGTKLYRFFTKGVLLPEELRSLFRAARGPENGLMSGYLGLLRRETH